ncbi:MAG: 3-isopropylmalate dehydratase small subunit [Patescibacteria group bacterium]
MIGKVIKKIGNDISTDIIYPGRFMATILPTETPRFAFADDTVFNEMLVSGSIPSESIILAGKNFGCGSSREQAVSAVHGHGLVIVAKGIARIFLRNAINIGLKVVVCPDIEAEEGDVLAVQDSVVVNGSTNRDYGTVPLPEAQKDIMDAGGLVNYTRAYLMNQQQKTEKGWQ